MDVYIILGVIFELFLFLRRSLQGYGSSSSINPPLPSSYSAFTPAPLYPMAIKILSSNAKKTLLSIALVPIWASLAGKGQSRKKEANRDAIESSLVLLLSKSFHGTPDGVYPSHAELLCSMSGPFEALIDKGYATVEHVQQVNASVDAAPAGETVKVLL